MKRLVLLIVIFVCGVTWLFPGTSTLAAGGQQGAATASQDNGIPRKPQTNPPTRPGTYNPSDKWPPQFPQPGALKILENDQVVVWDEMQTPYQHFHSHIYEGVKVEIRRAPDVTRYANGSYEIASDEESGRHPWGMSGRSRYRYAVNHKHAESNPEFVIPQRAIWIHLKKTLAKDAAEYSTDPTGKTVAAFPIFNPPAPAVLPTTHATQKKWPTLGEALGSEARKTEDNANVIVWDEVLRRTGPSFRKLVRDTVVVQLWDGPMTMIDGEGAAAVKVPLGFDQVPRRKMPSVYYLKAGTGPYSLAAVDAWEPARFIWVELRGTEAADCKNWSADPACK